MKIIKMKVSHYNKIHELWSKTSGLTLRKIDDSKEGIKKFIKRNPKTNFVCINNKQIIGTILCGHDGRKGFIYHTCVDSDFRNKGIGKNLVYKSIDSLKKEKITKVAILVNSDNIDGKEFWEKIGFNYAEELDYGIYKINERNI